jgi:hypothetical protein
MLLVLIATILYSSNEHCWRHQCSLLLWPGHIHAKTGTQIASIHYFGRSTYAQKAKKITFSIQLFPYPNSSEINKNHRNVLTVATDIADISNANCYCAFTGLVPHRSPKLGLGYLKTKACEAILKLVTRSRALVREQSRGFGEAVHASEQWPWGWMGRKCTRAGGGAPSYGYRSWWWRQPAVVEADGGEGVRACGWGPTYANFGLISSELVQEGDMQWYLFIY